jgi:hypothetical protein
MVLLVIIFFILIQKNPKVTLSLLSKKQYLKKCPYIRDNTVSKTMLIMQLEEE